MSNLEDPGLSTVGPLWGQFSDRSRTAKLNAGGLQATNGKSVCHV
jgi:hypothetical protein